MGSNRMRNEPCKYNMVTRVLIALLSAVAASALAARQKVELRIASDVVHLKAPAPIMRPASNMHPIIGILSQPGDAVPEGESYFSAGYVKWIESAGARVVPIQYDLSRAELKKRFHLINGLLLPGGNYPLSTTTRWFKAAQYLFDLAKEANRDGVTFPILGTCLGLQLLITLVCRDEYATSSVDAHNHPSQLNFSRALLAGSRLLAAVPHDVIHNLESYPIAMHNHHYGLLPATLEALPALRSFFDIVAIAEDRLGVRYASILEAKQFPFAGLAFHPEKVPYEWTSSLDIPHSRMAVDAAYSIAQAFVEQARGNNHGGASIVEEDEFVIYNFRPQFTGKHKAVGDEAFFEQTYVFKDLKAE